MTVMPKILAFDCETKPNSGYFWGLWDQNIGISQMTSSAEMLCWGARWLDQKQVTFRSVHHHGQETMLADLHKMWGQADYVMSWNGKQFDTKHVNREFLQHGLPPTAAPRDLDLMRAVKSRFKFPSYKMEYVAQALGLEGKTTHNGFQMWIDAMAGDEKAWRLMKKYQVRDVNILIEIYNKIKPWIPGSMHPNIGMWNQSDDMVCPRCGSNRLQKRGYERTSAGIFQRYQCQEEGCAAWSKSALRSKAVSGDGKERAITTTLRSL